MTATINPGAWATLARDQVLNAIAQRNERAPAGTCDFWINRARMRAYAVNAIRFARKSGLPLRSIWRPSK
jgi:hypothetical protein